MRSRARLFRALTLLVAVAPAAVAPPAAAARPPNGKAPARRENFTVAGHKAFVIPPPAAPTDKPVRWVWYAPTLGRALPGGAEKWMFDRFGRAGIAVAGIDVGESYGSPKGRAVYQALYEELTSKRGFHGRPVLLARSRGGLMLYNWAVEHPQSVGGIAGIYPVCNLTSYPGVKRAAGAYGMTADELEAKLAEYNPIDRLAPLARASVPIYHIHGDKDGTVPLESNSAELAKRYAAFGGPVEIEVIKGQGHNMWIGWFQSRNLTDFVIAKALGRPPAAPNPAAVKIPDQLPDPDREPPATDRPVKVYILAGQSNMVGMGEISGRSSRHQGFYLSADANAAQGVTVSVYRGKYSPDADYDKLKPELTETNVIGKDHEKPFASIPGEHTQVVRGYIEVKTSGRYRFNPGYGHGSYNVTTLAGKEVYRRDPGEQRVHQEVTLEGGKRYPVRIIFFGKSQKSFWVIRQDLPGTLTKLVRYDRKFPHLIDDKGEWTTRNDVWYHEARIAFKGGPLTVPPVAGNGTIGPELQFGHIMGHYHDEQVLVIKTAMGNRALAWDFRPPSSGKLPDIPEKLKKWEGLEYRLMVEGVRKTLDKISGIVPNYKGQGHEIAGFAWFQGHKDGGSQEWTGEYERNLVNLIEDVRAEFKAPKLPVVIATVGFGGRQMAGRYLKILEAQMAVSDPARHRAFAGTVKTVDTRGFWRSVEQSPKNQGYHYNRNAETYMLVGDALGRAMVELLDH